MIRQHELNRRKRQALCSIEEKWADSLSICSKVEIPVHKSHSVLKKIRNIDVDCQWTKDRYCQLFSVNHENVLRIYWSVENKDQLSNEIVILIEKPDCGSLYNHIHGTDSQNYTTNDALIWMLQCARGVEFLHGMKPTPLFHGNLMPNNLFLTDNFRCLKIGDIFLANGQDLHSVSLLNSIPYIAPEAYSHMSLDSSDNKLFMSKEILTEKFDVFGFGMVLWEVLSRRKPFYNKEQYDATSAYLFQQNRTSYEAYHLPPLSDVPDEPVASHIRSLISNCWAKERPIMTTIVRMLSIFIRAFFGNDNILDTEDLSHFEDVQMGELIGKGAFGTVHKATMHGIEVAVKRFRLNAKEGIEREVRHLSNANHENIVQMFSTMKDNSLKTIIVMEYADSGTLYNFLYSEDLKEDYEYWKVLNWMHQLANGVAYLHGMQPMPVIHRDLKPSNLLLANSFQTLKISDFGTVTEQATATATTGIGTAGYMSPEIASKKPYSEKTDVYSFGIVLWEVLSRKKPFYDLKNANPSAIIVLTCSGRHPPVKYVKNQVYSATLRKIIRSCLNIDAQLRPTMGRLAVELSITLSASRNMPSQDNN